MVFEIVVTDNDVILFDEKIVARNRDRALIELGRRLEHEDIEIESATILIREFVSSGNTQSGLKLNTAVANYVTNTGTTITTQTF